MEVVEMVIPVMTVGTIEEEVSPEWLIPNHLKPPETVLKHSSRG